MTNVDQALDIIKSMTLLELVDLNKKFTETFGITVKAPVSVLPVNQPSLVVEAVEEQTEFKVQLVSFTDKIGAIKVLREFTTLGLKEAKDLVESSPVVIKEGISKLDAEKIKNKLAEVNAVVEIS